MIEKMKALATECRQDAKSCLATAKRLRDAVPPAVLDQRWWLARGMSTLAAEMLILAQEIEREIYWLEREADDAKR